MPRGSPRIYQPLHPLRPLFDSRRNFPQLPPQHTNLLYRSSDILRQGGRDLFPHNARQLRPIPVGANHDLQGAIAMHASKVEIAFWRHIRDVGGDFPFFAQFPYLGRGFRVIDGCHDHVGAVEVGRDEFPVNVVDLSLLDPMSHFGIEAIFGRDDGDFGVGVEDIEDSTCCYLRL